MKVSEFYEKPKHDGVQVQAYRRTQKALADLMADKPPILDAEIVPEPPAAVVGVQVEDETNGNRQAPAQPTYIVLGNKELSTEGLRNHVIMESNESNIQDSIDSNNHDDNVEQSTEELGTTSLSSSDSVSIDRTNAGNLHRGGRKPGTEEPSTTLQVHSDKAIEKAGAANLSHGGRKPGSVNLTFNERLAILEMNRKGTSISAIARALDRDRSTVRQVIRKASKDLLTANLPDYVEIHKKAALVAAEEGNSKPAEWALERCKVVEPVQQQAQTGGFTVKIGIALPGLKVDSE